MECSLKLKRGRAVLVRLPHVTNSLHPQEYRWHVGEVVGIRKKGIRVAIVDLGTLETMRVVELSYCSLDRHCSLGMEITLPS